MKKMMMWLAMSCLCLGSFQAEAQLNVGKLMNAAGKATKALTLSDREMADIVHESVVWMDKNNPVAAEDDPYAVRLRRLTAGLNSVDGMPLNFKVYKVVDVNAFACPDGSVRVFSSLMDIMNDDELLGVIGHEIGHVARHHSKKALKEELLTGAARDVISANGGWAGALSESVLGDLSQSLIGAKYSQKQEKEADDYGYDFLKSHGKNPWGMIMAFEKLDSMSGGAAQSSYIQKMFSSHPDTKVRIKRLAERAEKDGIARSE